MPGFRTSEFIQRPREQVFDFATDPRNAPKWLTGVQKIELLTDGPIRAGTRFRETRVINKREAAAEIEVVEHERPRVHAAGAKFPGGSAVYRYEFHAEGSGTRVELVAEVRGKGLGWLMAPLMATVMKKMDGDQLQRLKAAIESET